MFPVTWRTLFGFLRRRDFLVTSDGLRKLIEAHPPYRNLEDAKIPIHVVATDILSAETVVLSKGPACDAILASAAIPAAFAPVQWSDLFLADGAISSNTPVRVAVSQGAKRLIILPTGYACARQAPPTGAVASALHALTLLIARQLISELEHFLRRCYPVLHPLGPWMLLLRFHTPRADHAGSRVRMNGSTAGDWNAETHAALALTSSSSDRGATSVTSLFGERYKHLAQDSHPTEAP